MSALLTIGVPIYNGEGTLERCLGSITAYAPEGVEVIMSDNASTDRTEAICREYAGNNPDFRYVRQAANIGSMENFKFLLAEARTPYFMWLADDDWLGDDFIDRGLQFLERHPDYVLATAGATAYYSRDDSEYQFTTLTASVEDDDPRRRVELFLENLADNSEFYGIYRRATMRFDPPEALGADWITMIDTSYLGKIRTIEGAVLHRQNRWDTPGRHAAVAAGAGLPAAQGRQPHYAAALAAVVHVALASPVYSGLAEGERLALAGAVLRGMRRHQGLPESTRYWPDAERLFGREFALLHGPALRALIERTCAGAQRGGQLAPEVLELALALNLGADRLDQDELAGQQDTVSTSLAALACRASREPAYRHPQIIAPSRLPLDVMDEYARFLTTPTQIFDSESDIEAYTDHLMRAMENLLPEESFAGHSLRLPRVRRRAIGALVRRLSMIPCYFSRRNLRPVMEKRAHLGTLWLQDEGVQVDAELQGGGGGRRLRVGLLMRDVMSLTDAYCAFPAIAQLDRERFETVALVTQVGDGSGTITAPERYFLGLAERATLLGGDIASMAAAVRAENFDFILFGNNTTAVSREIFFLSLCRLARWQIAFSPCCTTTGSRHMDFFVSSTLLEARGTGQDAYTERLLMIEGPGHARMVPPFEADLGVAKPSRRSGSASIRLVSGANHLKLTPQVRSTWMRVLACIPEATLALYPFGPAWLSVYDASQLERALRRDAKAAGVDFARIRVCDPFSSVPDIREFLADTDIYLDSFPFSGINSLLDPLMAGIPVVTLSGDSFRSNLGPSVLHETGLGEWVAATPDRYVEIVRQLASEPGLLAAAKRRVHQAMARGSRFHDVAWYSGQFGRIFEDIAAGRIER